MRALLDDHREALVRPILGTAGDTEVYVSGFTSYPFVQAIGERRGIPVINALLQPQFRTRSGAASVMAVRQGEQPTWTRQGPTVSRAPARRGGLSTR
ncbi:MAG: hypothetical protein R3C32_01725 [Chloroflexota bacterium]